MYPARAYKPPTGRFLSRDPLEELGGKNLYLFVGNNPVNALDILGLWGWDVHGDKTIDWAREVSYPSDARRRIASADVGVDGFDGSWSGVVPGYVPWLGSQEYHFNRNPNGVDSRFERSDFHFNRAKDLCHRYVDTPEDAADQLGIALHPIQDWVAHGDLDAGTLDTPKFHNIDSPQTELGTSWKLPDRKDLDAVGGPQGRPAGSAIHKEPADYHHGDREWAIFRTGSDRFVLTEQMTKNRLNSFRTFVARSGGCNCRKYFLGVQSRPWWL